MSTPVEVLIARLEVKALLVQFGPPRLGRWYLCDGCGMHTLPVVDRAQSVVRCRECADDIAPLAEVIRAGSLAAWHRNRWEWFVNTFVGPVSA